MLRTTVRHMSGKDLKFGNEARAMMLQGVDKLADSVQVCMRSPVASGLRVGGRVAVGVLVHGRATALGSAHCRHR